MEFSTTSPTTVLEPKTKKAKYPEARVIVLDYNFNTFEHVANCLLAIIEIAEMKFANIEEKEEKLDALVFLKNQILRKAEKLEIK